MTASKTMIPVVVFRHPSATFTIIFSHGNATDIGLMYSVYAAMCMQLKVNIVAYDYTGYGYSYYFGTRATEKQTYKDIEAVYDWCVESKLVENPATELILYGEWFIFSFGWLVRELVS